jgi:hypothetical protein
MSLSRFSACPAATEWGLFARREFRYEASSDCKGQAARQWKVDRQEALLDGKRLLIYPSQDVGPALGRSPCARRTIAHSIEFAAVKGRSTWDG